MTTVHNLTHSELVREAKRRGLVLTRPPVPIRPEEDRAIRLLVLAAEFYQGPNPDPSSAFELTLLAQYESSGINDWLWEFAAQCHATVAWGHG